jgi:hypothetical protein
MDSPFKFKSTEMQLADTCCVSDHRALDITCVFGGSWSMIKTSSRSREQLHKLEQLTTPMASSWQSPEESGAAVAPVSTVVQHIHSDSFSNVLSADGDTPTPKLLAPMG